MKTFLLFLCLASAALASGVSIVNPGARLIISVTSDGTPPFNYQWKKDGVDIVGATAATYTITSAKVEDTGIYTVSVTNSAGSALSDTAKLTVNGPVIPPAVVKPTKATTSINVTNP